MLSFGTNPAKNAAKKKAIVDIIGWIEKSLQMHDLYYEKDKYNVMVTEVQCFEPDCVPVETLIIVLIQSAVNLETSSKDSCRWSSKILKPIAEVDQNDIIALSFPKEWIGADMKLTCFREAVEAALNDSLSKNTELLKGMASFLELEATAIRDRIKEAEKAPPYFKSESITPLIDHANTLKNGNIVNEVVPNSASNITKVVMKSNVSKSDKVQNLKPVIDECNDNNKEKVVDTFKRTKIHQPATIIEAVQSITPRHEKGSTRPRGCPCCDPDNLDNIIDTMMFSNYPQA